eukprot:CAMPEP_0168746266 /NCGR_PEP_ID=MMETSP0724-20121128/15055_1 /TAXON_ID=265536 /ORGANISM="Amphiprora sp., Strain CCMP467" /LENGTH=192 /DNA_ID=CAMNT_0008794025 /DNA_START=245 /DNA_END=825 /DNA_ORIENTATION=-
MSPNNQENNDAASPTRRSNRQAAKKATITTPSTNKKTTNKAKSKKRSQPEASPHTMLVKKQSLLKPPPNTTAANTLDIAHPTNGHGQPTPNSRPPIDSISIVASPNVATNTAAATTNHTAPSPAFQDEVEQCVALQAVMDGFPGCHELFAVVVNLGDQWDDRIAVPRCVEFIMEFNALVFIVGCVSVVEMFE